MRFQRLPGFGLPGFRGLRFTALGRRVCGGAWGAGSNLVEAGVWFVLTWNRRGVAWRCLL